MSLDHLIETNQQAGQLAGISMPMIPPRRCRCSLSPGRRG
jgi:hypothetical protein